MQFCGRSYAYSTPLAHAAGRAGLVRLGAAASDAETIAAVKSDRLIGELSKDWDWVSLRERQYCAGRNLGNAFCEDFKWWVLGAAALVVAIVAWWILGKIAKVYGN